MKRLLLLGATPLLAANLAVSPRSPTLAGTLDEAFLEGTSVPAVRNADQDGLQEDWSLFPGLPLPLSLGLSDGPSLSVAQGNAWAGPPSGDSLETRCQAGLGGAPWLLLRQATSLPDTPLTRIGFWRGAVGAYRFGLDLERRLTHSVGLRVSTQARAYPSRKWSYRDQVYNAYVGSAGRTLADLPLHGTTPGLDEMRWEMALSTALPGGTLEGGWRWNDVTRGWPDPSDTATLPASGLESSTEGFLNWNTRISRVHAEGGASFGSLAQTRPRWSLGSDSTPEASFQGSDVKARALVQWEGDGWRLGPEVLFLRLDGTKDASSPWLAQLHREGLAFRAGDTSGLGLEAGAGLTQGTVAGRDLGLLEDWNLAGRWTRRITRAEVATSRRHRIPLLTESVLGEATTRWLPSSNLLPERTDLQEAALRLAPWPFLSLDGGVAFVTLDNRIAPAALPTDRSPALQSDINALRLSNLAGTASGLGWRTGIRLGLGGWSLRSELCRSRMETPSGAVDLSLPQLWTRTILDWQGRVLAGHMLLNARLGLRTASESFAWAGTGNGSATRVRLSPTTLIDLDTRFEIGRFGLYWNLQNLGDQKASPVPGWSALGVRSGFGVHWTLAG